LTTPRVRMPRHVARLVIDYFDYAVHPGALAHCAARHPAFRRLLRLCRASRYLAMSRGSSRGSSRRSSLTTPLRSASECLGTSRSSSSGSSSTTSPTPRVRLPRHVERLVA
jgi:hypothetical protein